MKQQHHRLQGARKQLMQAIRSLMVSVMLSVLMLSIAPLAAAQAQPDLEAFRSDLVQVLEELHQHTATLRQNPLVAEVLAQSNLNAVPTLELEEVRKQLQQMSPEDLAQVYQGFTAAFPNWRDAPEVLGRLARQIDEVTPRGPIFAPQAITPDNCQDAFDAAPSFTDWSATTAGVIAAAAAADIIPAPLNVVAVPFRAGLEAGALVAETLNLIFDRCSGDQSIAGIETTITDAVSSIINNATTNSTAIINNATTNTTAITNNDNTNTATITNNDNSNRTTIVNNDNTNKNTIVTNLSDAQSAIITSGDANSAAIVSNDNINKNTIVANDNTNTTNVLASVSAAQTAIINNSNANTTTIVNNDNANKNELRDLMLRTQIEQDLAEADNAVSVALFLTPTANGGHLDLVQSIVTETLANIQAAGGSIGQAQSFLSQADADKAAGDFKAAYKGYRKAYKAAVS